MEGDKSAAGQKPDSVMDLMEKLHKDIQKSDWLEKNTAEKWQAENPDLASDYMKAIGKDSIGSQTDTSNSACGCSNAENSDKIET